MNDPKNVELIRQAYAAFGRGDIAGLLELFGEDIDWQMYGPSELPTSGLRKGKAEVARFFKQVDEAWSFERFEPRQFLAQGDEVVALGHYSGTAKPTGRKFGAEWAHVFAVRQGKVARFREYTDTANLIAALSRTPAGV